MNIKEQIRRLKSEKEASAESWEKQEKLREEKRKEEEYDFSVVRDLMALAPKSLYEEWLTGYLKDGNEIGSVEEKYPNGDFFVAIIDFKFVPRYGTQSFKLIVPKGIKVTGEWGHCEVFFIENFTTNSCAPYYENLNIEE